VTADASTLARERKHLVAAAQELLTPLAKAALCADFEAQMRNAVLGFIRGAPRR